MFKLTIRTPYETKFDGEVESLYFTAEDGDMQIFENHASVTASLFFSPIVIEEENKEETFLARTGIFLFDNEKNEAMMLATSCEKKSEINYKTIKKYSEFIDNQLAEGKELSDFHIAYLKNEKVAIEQEMEEVTE